MSTPNFTSVLETPLDEVERPKPIPTGTYIGQIVGMPSSKDIMYNGEEQEVDTLNIKLISPMQLDNPDALADYGDLSAARPQQKTFWFHKPYTPDEIFGFKQFVANTLKMEIVKGKTSKQYFAEMPGKQLIVTIGHKPGVDKNTNEAVTYSNITATAAL